MFNLLPAPAMARVLSLATSQDALPQPEQFDHFWEIPALAVVGSCLVLALVGIACLIARCWEYQVEMGQAVRDAGKWTKNWLVTLLWDWPWAAILIYGEHRRKKQKVKA